MKIPLVLQASLLLVIAMLRISKLHDASVRWFDLGQRIATQFTSSTSSLNGHQFRARLGPFLHAIARFPLVCDKR
jgi:hypothetical protein